MSVDQELYTHTGEINHKDAFASVFDRHHVVSTCVSLVLRVCSSR